MAVLLVLGLALAGCGESTTTTTAAETTTTGGGGETTTTSAEGGEIIIGAVFGTTGKYAGGEAGIGNGAQMAIDEVNAAGGIDGKKLVLVIEDTTSEQAGAVNAYNRIVAKEPLVVIDTALSSFVLAQMQDIEKAQIPTYPMGENPALTQQGNPWILRFSTPDNVTPVAAVQFALDELGKSKVAILRVNNEFGQTWEELIKAELTNRGLEPVAVEVFGADDKDMTAQLNNIKSSGADVMIVTADPTTHAVIIKQRVQFGMSDIEYVGSNTAVMPQTLELLTGGEAEGIYALTSAVPPEDPDPAVREWNERYKAEFGIDADYIAADAYDAVIITVDAVRNVGLDRAAIRDWILENVKGVKGMGNVWNFTPEGDGGTQVSIAQVKEGAVEIIETIATNIE
jgi:branched-chain amino acid transport system substrate-binding protein